MASKCRRLTQQEQQEWDNLQTYNDKLAFVHRIMGNERLLSPREDFNIGSVPIGSNTPDLIYEEGKGLPRLSKLELEEQRLKTAIDANPEIKKFIHVNETSEALQTMAETTIIRLQTELKTAQDLLDKGELNSVREQEQETVVEDRIKQLKKISEEVGLPSSTLLTKPWSEFNSTEKVRISLTLVPDHSLDAGVIDQFRDKALVFSSMSRVSDLPFLSLHERIEEVRGYCARLQDEYLRRITDNPSWKRLTRDNKKMEKVALIINSRDPDAGVTVPDPVTVEDYVLIDIANSISSTFKEWEPVIRFMRFIEAYEDDSTVDSISKRLSKDPQPDLIADITEAKTILEGNGGIGTDNGENALWVYLAGKDWGVRKSGFDPRSIPNPNLQIDEPPWTAVRGAASLMPRIVDKMPWNQYKNLLQRYDSYNLSIALRYFLRREVQDLHTNYKASYDKWSNPEHVQSYLRKYLRAVQGFPDEDYNFIQALAKKIQQWASPNVFWSVYSGVRNVVQPIFSFPYREELIKSIGEFKSLSSVLRTESEEVFTNIIDQSGRALRNWMFQGEEINILGEVSTWLKEPLHKVGYIFKPLDFLSSMTAKIPTMAVTDKISRSAAFKAMLVKANRATEQYKKDHNMQKWWDNSGINSGYITPEQQNHILGYLALGDETTSWAMQGLLEVSGYDSAILKIAKETTDRTLYLYDKAIAASIHSGSGRGMTSLLTFPRSTIQMYAMQFAKAVNKESSIQERFAASKNILALFLVGELLGSLSMMVSGRRKKEYSIVNTLTWQFGGLGYGVAADAINTLNDIFLASAGSDEDKKYVISRLPSEISRLGDVLVGFWKVSIDLVDLTTGTQDSDIRFLRKIRAIFDENYTPAKQEEVTRTVIENFQKGLFGSDAPDPDYYEKEQIKLYNEEQRLGEISLSTGGESYTVKQFGQVAGTTRKKIPDWLITEDAGWSKLTMFYCYSEDMFQEYNTLPSKPTKIRESWRKTHPEEEALMMFWGKFDKSVYTRGSKEGTELLKLLLIWWDLYGITPDKRAKATWFDGGEIVP